MQRSFYHDEFEELIKDKADQFKMYPSSRVWKGIYRSLHSARRWYWFSFLLFLAGLSYFAVEVLSISSTRKSISQNKEPKSAAEPAVRHEPANIVPFTAVPSSGRVTTSLSSRLRSEAPVIPLYRSKPAALQTDLSQNGEIPTGPTGSLESDQSAPGPAEVQATKDAPLAAADLPEGSRVVPVPENSFHTGSGLSPLQQLSLKAVPRAPETLQSNKKINWLQEYAVYELTPPKMNRLAWQLSFSPTMNYRKLFGNNNANIESDVKNIPIASNIQGNIDQLVNHKPAVGFELGSFMLYQLNRNLTIKAGVQFNYSQYDIRAYGSRSSEIATIALNNFAGFNPDSITTITSLRNFGGNEKKNLRNQYFQLSSPVGLEFLVFGNRNIQLAVAGTIQPTYLMNRNTYLITTDYKNYTHEPSLVRRWNVNTSVEAFIAYKAAGLKWQIGPQFRYQLLSTYNDQYPIKEYLMEYGVKLGISKTIRH